MIRNQWYAILESKELRKKKKVIGITRFGEKLVLWRDQQGKIHCLYDQCCHRGAALSIGKVVNDHIQCPFHGLEYDETGKCTVIPANSILSNVPNRFHVQAYKIEEKHGFIWIWWGDFQQSYPEIPWFDELDETFHYYTIRDHWKAHYSRVIENQLDVIHLPFVHHNTIGRGRMTVVEGPIVEISDDYEQVWYMNRKEDGTLPKPIKTLKKPNQKPLLHFKFPHIWQNYLSRKSRILVAFTPVDEENTLVYARFCQKIIRIPILKQFVSWMGKLSSIIILHQDRRVVQTQIPKPSSYKGNEILLQGDLPIIYYRKRRHELKQKYLQ